MNGESKEFLKQLSQEFSCRVKIIYYTTTNLKKELLYVKKYIDTKSWWSRTIFITPKEYYKSEKGKAELINKRLK